MVTKTTKKKAMKNTKRKKPKTRTQAKTKTKAKVKTKAKLPTKTSAKTDPLRVAVLAARDDEATLQVWADALLERNDPRGELIQLELSKPSSPERDKLIAAHIRKHARALLGDLASVVMLKDHLVFDRGLLSECAIATDSRPKIAAVVGHPDWTTVRSIYFRNFSGGSLSPEEETRPHPAVALLLDDSLSSLHVALGIGIIDVLAPLCASPRPLALTRVFLMNYDYDDSTPVETRTQIAQSKALPNLRSLGTEGVPPKWLLEADWAKRLDTIEMEISAEMVDDALAFLESAAPQVTTAVIRPDSVFENGFDRPAWVYRFSKQGKRFATVEASVLGDRPALPKDRKDFLASIPKRIKFVEA